MSTSLDQINNAILDSITPNATMHYSSIPFKKSETNKKQIADVLEKVLRILENENAQLAGLARNINWQTKCVSVINKLHLQLNDIFPFVTKKISFFTVSTLKMHALPIGVKVFDIFAIIIQKIVWEAFIFTALKRIENVNLATLGSLNNHTYTNLIKELGSRVFPSRLVDVLKKMGRLKIARIISDDHLKLISFLIGIGVRLFPAWRLRYVTVVPAEIYGIYQRFIQPLRNDWELYPLRYVEKELESLGKKIDNDLLQENPIDKKPIRVPFFVKACQHYGGVSLLKTVLENQKCPSCNVPVSLDDVFFDADLFQKILKSSHANA